MAAPQTGALIFGGAFFNNHFSHEGYNGMLDFRRIGDTPTILRGVSGRFYDVEVSPPIVNTAIRTGTFDIRHRNNADRRGLQWLSSHSDANNPDSRELVNAPMNLIQEMRNICNCQINDEDPRPIINIDIAALRPFITTITTQHSGNQLNELFDNPATPKFIDQAGEAWMVIRSTHTGQSFNQTGLFTRRMILLIEDIRAFAGNFYRSAQNQGNSLIIVSGNNGEAQQLGNSGFIRGLIVNLSNNQLILSPGEGQQMEIRGAVYTMAGRFRMETGNRITFTYRPEVLEEISQLGIIQFDGNDNDGPPELALIPLTINPRGPFTELWNRSF